MFRVYRRLFISMSLLVTLNFQVNAQELPTAPPQATAKNETVSSDDQKQADNDKALKEKTASTPAVKEKFSPAIADNSFLIEEAYNQEPGVVQHVCTCAGKRQPQRDIVCSFTQEWPVTNLKHQLSYTLPYSSLNSNQYHGVGDVMLNYRYQWKGEEDWALIAPRFTLILPTGNVPKGLGTGSSGIGSTGPGSGADQCGDRADESSDAADGGECGGVGGGGGRIIRAVAGDVELGRHLPTQPAGGKQTTAIEQAVLHACPQTYGQSEKRQRRATG